MVCVILVAEDEVTVRNLVRHVLEAEGHEVLAAADGEEALTISRQYAGTIDMLITDVVMPRLDGLSLVAEIRKHRPDLRVLVISGKTSAELRVDKVAVPYLRKPFVPSVLRAKVREMLQAPPNHVQ